MQADTQTVLLPLITIYTSMEIISTPVIIKPDYGFMTSPIEQLPPRLRGSIHTQKQMRRAMPGCGATILSSQAGL